MAVCRLVFCPLFEFALFVTSHDSKRWFQFFFFWFPGIFDHFQIFFLTTSPICLINQTLIFLLSREVDKLDALLDCSLSFFLFYPRACTGFERDCSISAPALCFSRFLVRSRFFRASIRFARLSRISLLPDCHTHTHTGTWNGDRGGGKGEQNKH